LVWMEVKTEVDVLGYVTVGVFFDLSYRDMCRLKEKIEELGDFKCVIFAGKEVKENEV